MSCCCFIADFEYPPKWCTSSAVTVWFSVTWLVPRGGGGGGGGDGN